MSEFNLPEGWVETSLDSVSSDVSYGYTAKSTTDKVGPHLLRITDIQDNQVDWKSVPFCEIEKGKADQYLLKADDLVFARTGATVGKSFLIKGNIPESVFASYLIRVRSVKQIDINYLAHFFNSASYWNQITEFSSGIGQPNVNGTKLKELNLPLAPLAEQQQIAQKLDELLAQVDTLKTRLDAIPKILKRFRQSVLAAAVSGRLTEEWRNGDTSKIDGKFLVIQLKKYHEENGGHARGNASEPTEEAHNLTPSDIPNSWGIGLLRDICAPGRPITYGILKPGPELEVGIPYIRVADFPGNKLNLSNIKKTSNEIDEQFKRARLITGDLLLSIRGSVGRLIKIPAEMTGANITQDTARLSISSSVVLDYIYYALLSDSVQRRMSNAIRGVAVRGINIGDVRALQIPMPSKKEQTEIVRRVEQLFAYADKIEQRVKDAQTRVNHLTQSILAKAFRGELTAEWRAQNPELISGKNSAAALLERIKAEREAAVKSKRKIKA